MRRTSCLALAVLLLLAPSIARSEEAETGPAPKMDEAKSSPVDAHAREQAKAALGGLDRVDKQCRLAKEPTETRLNMTRDPYQGIQKVENQTASRTRSFEMGAALYKNNPVFSKAVTEAWDEVNKIKGTSKPLPSPGSIDYCSRTLNQSIRAKLTKIAGP